MNWKQTRRTENNIDRLYPSRLVEEYRKTVRGLYNTHYGEDGLENPTPEEWQRRLKVFCEVARMQAASHSRGAHASGSMMIPIAAHTTRPVSEIVELSDQAIRSCQHILGFVNPLLCNVDIPQAVLRASTERASAWGDSAQAYGPCR